MQARREDILQSNSKYRKYWNALKKNDAKLDEKSLEKNQFERNFLVQHLKKFLNVLDSISATAGKDLCYMYLYTGLLQNKTLKLC